MLVERREEKKVKYIKHKYLKCMNEDMAPLNSMKLVSTAFETIFV